VSVRTFIEPEHEDTLTDEELALLRALDRLASRWSRHLSIASMGGTLCVFRNDAMHKPDRDGTDSVDAEKALWMCSTIPNTGGDW
jgi:hypothetical protein